MLAYLTAHDSVTNTFTVGNVDIEVVEPSYPGNDSPDVKDLVPWDEVPKDPAIHNKGANEAIVFMTVTLPLDQGTDVLDWRKADGEYNSIDGKWIPIDRTLYYDADGNQVLDRGNAASVMYVYGYDEVLPAGDTTVSLFDFVRIANVGHPGDVIDMVIDGYAIQKNHVADADGVLNENELGRIYDILVGELGGSGSEDKEEIVLTTDGDIIMGAGETVQTHAYINGVIADDEVQWFSDNENITVDNGMIETKAIAAVGETAEITVVAGDLDDEVASIGIVAHADDSPTATFTVTITDIEFSVSELNIKPGESETITAKIIPETIEGTVSWTRTSVSGINLVKNGNEVTIKIADDMEPGKSYDIIASFGEFSKRITVNIIPFVHEHNYVDGVCTGCNEIDPNHTHNYENGVCTVCGKENDLYEMAPVNEFKDWRYRLDTINEEIILERYNNTSAENVIVYNNYEINGVIYKTKISNNIGTWSYNPTVTTYGDYMFIQRANIKTITFGDEVDTSDVTNMSCMFGSCTALTDIDFGDNFDTSNVTRMDSMFRNCQSLTYLDLSSFDTSNVKDMTYMLADCSSLMNIDFGDSFTDSVTSMSHMFEKCTSLETLDLSAFNTSNVNSMTWMFYQCTSLVAIDFGNNFDTCEVTSMRSMFDTCNNLAALNLSNFNTGKVTNMQRMFQNCNSLISLDLSSFDTSNVTIMEGMFFSCPNLETVYVTSGKWSTAKADKSYMFSYSGTSSVTYK